MKSALAGLLLSSLSLPSCAEPSVTRIATFNTSLNFPAEGAITEALCQGHFENAERVAAIIRTIRPDIILLNEFDYVADGSALDCFQRRYLEQGQRGAEPIHYPHRFLAPVNTGVSTGVDVDGDGEISGPRDAHGWGEFEGQYGMAILSRFPLDADTARSFQTFLWKDMPDAWWPLDPESGAPYYSEETQAVLRLSSKSHWDVPVDTPAGRLHLLASHPTPPVFDGPENRNGRRNHDEIRFWIDYLHGADYMQDDQGGRGGLPEDAQFVLLGDLNADPLDGDSSSNPAAKLLAHPRISASPTPVSAGAGEAARRQGLANDRQRGDPTHDTGDFNDSAVGNLRLDYVLPSAGLPVVDAGVFWPLPNQPQSDWLQASDHRLVWIDLVP